MVAATLADYPAFQNLARFYVYDMSRYCGGLSGWECPDDGLYEAYDFRPYFETANCFPFSLYAGEERAGFVVVKNIGDAGKTLWNMEQFFVTAKFQRQGHGGRLAGEIWKRYRGPWRIEVIPENTRGIAFWQEAIERKVGRSYRREILPVTTHDGMADRIVFTLDC